jgi:hypothetical protein
MLDLNELSNRIAALALDENAQVEDFVIWFRKASKNIHLSDDEDAQSAVSAVESVLSEYYFADLDETNLKVHLTSAIIPFVDPFGANSSADLNALSYPSSGADFAANEAISLAISA